MTSKNMNSVRIVYKRDQLLKLYVCPKDVPMYLKDFPFLHDNNTNENWCRKPLPSIDTPFIGTKYVPPRHRTYSNHSGEKGQNGRPKYLANSNDVKYKPRANFRKYSQSNDEVPPNESLVVEANDFNDTNQWKKIDRNSKMLTKPYSQNLFSNENHWKKWSNNEKNDIRNHPNRNYGWTKKAEDDRFRERKEDMKRLEQTEDMWQDDKETEFNTGLVECDEDRDLFKLIDSSMPKTPSEVIPPLVEAMVTKQTEPWNFWYYKGVSNTEEGPYTSETMANKFATGFFNYATFVRRHCDERFFLIAEYRALYRRIPFTDGPAIPPILHSTQIESVDATDLIVGVDEELVPVILTHSTIKKIVPAPPAAATSSSDSLLAKKKIEELEKLLLEKEEKLKKYEKQQNAATVNKPGLSVKQKEEVKEYEKQKNAATVNKNELTVVKQREEEPTKYEKQKNAAIVNKNELTVVKQREEEPTRSEKQQNVTNVNKNELTVVKQREEPTKYEKQQKDNNDDVSVDKIVGKTAIPPQLVDKPENVEVIATPELLYEIETTFELDQNKEPIVIDTSEWMTNDNIKKKKKKKKPNNKAVTPENNTSAIREEKSVEKPDVSQSPTHINQNLKEESSSSPASVVWNLPVQTKRFIPAPVPTVSLTEIQAEEEAEMKKEAATKNMQKKFEKESQKVNSFKDSLLKKTKKPQSSIVVPPGMSIWDVVQAPPENTTKPLATTNTNEIIETPPVAETKKPQNTIVTENNSDINWCVNKFSTFANENRDINAIVELLANVADTEILELATEMLDDSEYVKNVISEFVSRRKMNTTKKSDSSEWQTVGKSTTNAQVNKTTNNNNNNNNNNSGNKSGKNKKKKNRAAVICPVQYS